MDDKQLAQQTKDAFQLLNSLLHDCYINNISVDFDITPKTSSKQNHKLKLNYIKKDLLK